jgi:uncharacterized protein
VIDIHTHLHPEKLGQAIRKWFAENSTWKLYHACEPAPVATALQSHGVERFVFCSYAHKRGIARGINAWLVQTAKELGGCGLPLFTVHLDDPAYLEDAKRAIAGGCIGLKIHEDVQKLAIDDPRFSQVYSLIEKIDGLVLAHIGPIPWRAIPEAGVMRVQRVKTKHPKLKLVVAHMGAPDTDLYFDLLDTTPALYLDTTMSLSDIEGLKSDINLAKLEKHSQRILFGSDYPNIPYEYHVEPSKLKSTGLSPEALKLIMGENARHLLSPFL